MPNTLPIVSHLCNPTLHTSIKGDQGLRESVFQRKKHNNVVDANIESLSSAIFHLLSQTGVFDVRMGLNNGQIETSTIFDPFNKEIHLASNLLKPAYLENNFTRTTPSQKIAFINSVCDEVCKQPSFADVAIGTRDSILKRNGAHFTSTDRATQLEQVKFITESIPLLRDIENYHLRTISINVFNSVVSMTFNCDGTQIMNFSKFKSFMVQYIMPDTPVQNSKPSRALKSGLKNTR